MTVYVDNMRRRAPHGTGRILAAKRDALTPTTTADPERAALAEGSDA